MREIEFKGLGISDKRWHYGFITIYESGKVIVGGFEVYPESVGQYTGLKDKNGKRVYEKDIVKVWRDGFCRMFTVKWREEGVPMYILYPQPLNEDFWYLRSNMEMSWENIGNIFENPELLTK